jgi:hypothetical protein
VWKHQHRVSFIPKNETSELFTVTLTGDTANIVQTAPGFFINTGTATFSLGGVNGTFPDPGSEVFDSHSVPAAGINTAAATLITTENAAFC